MVIFYAVDCQKDFMDADGALNVPGAGFIKSNIRKLCKQSIIDKVPLFASKDWHEEDDVEFKVFPKHCVKFTKGAMLIPEVADYQPERIFLKKTYDIFAEPEFLQFLKASGVDLVFVFGVVTEICVKAAVEGFLKQGIKVSLVTDAIMHLDKAKADALIEDWKKQGVEMNTTDEIVD